MSTRKDFGKKKKTEIVPQKLLLLQTSFRVLWVADAITMFSHYLPNSRISDANGRRGTLNKQRYANQVEQHLAF